MKRRDFIYGTGAVALRQSMAWAKHLNTLTPVLAGALNRATLRPYVVEPAPRVEAVPFGSNDRNSELSFKLRGIKGYAWSPEQYLAEIPVMAKYRLNFLMNCYSSFWELGDHGKWVTDRAMNFWYRPLPEETRKKFEKVIRACHEHRIAFCLSVNPNLKSDRPFDYESPGDLEALWQHYRWAQRLGVSWFNVSLDDIDRKISAHGHAALLNKMLDRLRKQDPQAQLIFCPTWYAGTGEAEIETPQILGLRSRTPHAGETETPGMRYIKTLADELHPDVYIFWTGPEVEPPSVSTTQASRYRALIKHRVFLWDNYPVNDQTPALDLGPLRGRDAGLSSILDGYMSNSMGYENEANRIPLLTIADYAWNPKDYDPERSIGQSIAHLGDSAAKRETLKNLVELYPGRLWDGANRAQWNSLRALFEQYVAAGQQREALDLFNKAQKTLIQMKTQFPDAWSSGSRVLEIDVNELRKQISKLEDR